MKSETVYKAQNSRLCYQRGKVRNHLGQIDPCTIFFKTIFYYLLPSQRPAVLWLVLCKKAASHACRKASMALGPWGMCRAPMLYKKASRH
jgi:hypothetical protein